MTSFAGKTLFVTGDSITDPSNGLVARWCDLVAAKLGCNLINDAKAGTGLVMPAGGNHGIFTRIDSWDNYGDFDAIIVNGNLNDSTLCYTGSLPLGSLLGSLRGTEPNSQYSIVRGTIEKILNKYPNKQLLWLTSTPRLSWPGYNEKLWGKDSFWAPYNAAIVQTCAHYGVPCLDLYSQSGLRPWLSTECFSEWDKIHPTQEGHNLISSKIYAFVLANL